MIAIAFAQYGPPDVLQPIAWDPPAPTAGEVRVHMLAAGVAPVDAKLRAGLLQAHFQPPLPKIPGRDGVGVVEQIGADVRGLKVGDAVCLMVEALGAGTYAQVVTCSADRVVARPAGLTTQQAAALLQPANSAWIAVMETAQVQSGMCVLVHGGAGAVGSQMVQLCRHLGAEVTATCRDANRDYVQGLGASRAIGYDGTEDFASLRDQDVVFDLIGGATHARSYPVLRPGGHLVYLTAAPVTDLSAQHGVRTSRAQITDARHVLLAVADLASQGVLQPRVAATFTLTDAARAHAALEAGQITRGRAVLAIADA